MKKPPPPREGKGVFFCCFFSRGFFVIENSVLSFHEKVTENEDVHFGAEEAIERFFGATDDRFVFVEGGVEDEGDGGQRTEGRDQLMVKGLVSRWTVWRRPEPSTWQTAGIRARFSSRIWKTCIM